MASKRFAEVQEYCVACGSCVKVCPMEAITIWKGVIAHIQKDQCVGCGRCVTTCPASTIELKIREVL